jgi:hypothetical protein
MIETIKNQVFLELSNVQKADNNRNNTQYPTLTRLPITYVAGVDKSCEFKIPYSSRFVSVLNSRLITENAEASSELSNLGYIYIVVNRGDPFDSEDAQSFDLFFSLGDEARFGTLYRVPKLFTNSIVDDDGKIVGSPAPASYAFGAPPANTLVRL